MGGRLVPEAGLGRAGGRDFALAATVGASLVVLGSAFFLPWLRSGTVSRSAFALARSAAILGLFDGWQRRLCLALWLLLPFFVAACWTAAALRRPAWVAATGGLVGVMSVVAGSLVIAAVRTEPGPIAALITGALAIICSGRLALVSSSARGRGAYDTNERGDR